MKILVLFSGTGSIEKPFEDEEIHEIRGVDLDNTFKPYYNVDILEWKYKKELKKWRPDYVHSSPVCKHFSKLKQINESSRDLEEGFSLVDKTLEIIDYCITLNKNVKWTIENPKNRFMRKKLFMLQMITTSYCMYGFPYQKDTDFWFGGFNLILKPKCRGGKNKDCESRKKYGCHQVRLGLSHNKDVGTYKRTNSNQIGDVEYFKGLREQDESLKKYSDTYFRYRIPYGLCYDIMMCVTSETPNKPFKSFFGRTGGKHFSKKSILPMIKNLHYSTYLEPFVGAGSIFLGRDRKCRTEVINDKDILCINLWRGMKHCGDDLINYQSYFEDKSKFKWFLLKEKQNRRIKKQKEHNDIEDLKEDLIVNKFSFMKKGDKPSDENVINNCYEIKNGVSRALKNDVKIETLKEDLFLVKKCRFSDTTQNLPNQKCCLKNSSLQLTANHNEVKIEILKEDLFICKNSRMANNNNHDCNNGVLNVCACIKDDKTNRRVSQEVKIENNEPNYLLGVGGCNMEFIEDLKEDLFITKNSFLQNNKTPNDRLVQNKASMYYDSDGVSRHTREEVRIENLKEDLFITKLSVLQQNNNPNNGYVTYNKCVHSNTTYQFDNKIEDLKEDLFINKNSRMADNEHIYRKMVTPQQCLCIKDNKPTSKDQELRIEDLKEDLFICKNSRMSNNWELHKLINKNVSRHTDNSKNEDCKVVPVENEEKPDDEIIVSIEKTDEGLKLIKQKFYVRNKKHSGDETKWRLHNPNMCGWSYLLKSGHIIKERLKDTIILNKDFIEVVEEYNNEDQLTYMDAPWSLTGDGKRGDRCYNDFAELEDVHRVACSVKGYCMLSYNNHPTITELFKDWNIMEVGTQYTQKKAGDRKVKDLLIMNWTEVDGVITKLF